MTVAKASEAVKVKSNLTHTVNYLKTLGVPESNSIQVKNSDRLYRFSQQLRMSIDLLFMNC